MSLYMFSFLYFRYQVYITEVIHEAVPAFTTRTDIALYVYSVLKNKTENV